MPPSEIASRVGDHARHLVWSRRQVTPADLSDLHGPVRGLLHERRFASVLPDGVAEAVPTEARDALVAAADRLLAGDWTVLGSPRPDIVDPDWFLDPVTGRRAPQTPLAFAVDHRDERVTGNVKAVWELSRHHHLTLLAGAWWLTGDERYAAVVDAQLRSWWSANPYLSGVHWTSGIELGVRLVSWVWVRRLLDGWAGVSDLFDDNELALRQIAWHQEYLAAFRSRGSSANNHVVAEACGRFSAACAFPWYASSDRWRAQATRELVTALSRNTFASGVNRELATDYHRFVTELGLVALAEGDRAGHPLPDPTRRLLVASLDAAAALLDDAGRAPRQGDGDEGRGLVVEAPDVDPWMTLLDAGAAVFGPLAWWPQVGAGVTGHLVAAVTRPAATPDRPATAPAAFTDAGIRILRTQRRPGEPSLWCRCDGGPHGFLSIAAHAHADALSLEVRHGSVDLFADPGTYCYHGEPEWRSYFRSTRAHNTVEIDGASQSIEGGPFLWRTHTDAVAEPVPGAVHGGAGVSQGERRRSDGATRQTWAAHHTGYARLDPVLRHTRRVTLDPDTGDLQVVDTLVGSSRHTARLFWHLGPEVSATLDGCSAHLSWAGDHGPREAVVELPPQLRWTAHRGETDPILGWYSPRFGEREPSTALVGGAEWTGSLTLCTTLRLQALSKHPGPKPQTAVVPEVPEITLTQVLELPGGRQ
ncbi:alginate lyase family protein [Intrasporangium sp. YIM S08009]|uniref:alginate lyase family protein n=1 Tax=Intrasporangium zincisolvens TaxID=3080018 RepID=UPI002B0601C7|nr:alginate lyase family protein [Intrasporangium sp. YIM S08009]